MRPFGRKIVALVGLVVATALLTGTHIASNADTLKADAELSTKEIGSKENIVGNAIADAIRASAKSDIAFIAADYFNEIKIPKGNFDSTEFLKALVMPSDKITIVKLTGDQITRAMERSLFLYPKFNSGFLQVSGMTVTFKPDGDVDRRILSIKVDGDALDNAKTYTVAMPAPLADGGLAYFKIWKKTDIDKKTEKTLQDALTAYYENTKSLPKGEERLVAKKQ